MAKGYEMPVEIKLDTKKALAEINKFHQEASKKLNLTENVKEARKETDGLLASLTGVKSILRGMAVYHITFGIIGTFKTLASDAYEFSSSLDHLRVGLDELQNANQNLDLMSLSMQLREASDNTLSLADAMQKTSEALLLGGDPLVENLPQLFEIARVTGRAMGLDVEKSIESMIIGLGRLSPRWLDNLGIIVDTREAYKELAAEKKKAVSALSEEEKRLALINAIFDKYGALIEDSSARTRTMAENAQYLASSWEDFMGAMLSSGGTIDKIVVALGDLLSKMAEAKMWTGELAVATREYGLTQENLKDILENRTNGLLDYIKVVKQANEYQTKLQFLEIKARKDSWSPEYLRDQIVLLNSEYADLIDLSDREIYTDIGKLHVDLAKTEIVLDNQPQFDNEMDRKFREAFERSVTNAFESGKITSEQFKSLYEGGELISAIDVSGLSQPDKIIAYNEAYKNLYETLDALVNINKEIGGTKAFEDYFKEETVNSAEQLANSLRQLENDASKLSGYKFGESISVGFEKARKDIEGILSSSAPLEQKMSMIKVILDGWGPAIQNTKAAIDELSGAASSLGSRIDSALIGVAEFVSRDTFIKLWEQGQEVKASLEGMAESGTDLAGTLYDVEVKGGSFIDFLDEIKKGASSSTSSLDNLKSKIESDVVSVLSNSIKVKPWDFLDGYQDSPLENVRKMFDVANLGTQSPWYNFFVGLGEIPPEIIAQGEQAIKAYAQMLAEQGQNLERPDWLDTDALVRELEKQLKAEEARKQTISLAVDAALASGLYSSYGEAESAVKKLMGEPDSKGYVDGIIEGLGKQNLPLSMSELFIKQVGEQEDKFKEVGEIIADAIWQGLQERISDNTLVVPTVFSSVGGVSESEELP